MVVAILTFAVISTAPCAQYARAAEPVPVRQEISGGRFAYQVGEADSSDSIAARFGEPELTLFSDGNEPEAGSTITIDNRHVAPAAVDQGVVINVPQRMLFVFRDGHLAGAWPITVGRPDWPTPLGSYRIASFSFNPTWHVPPAIRAEMEEEGIPTLEQVKPGPANPLGKRWIGLDHGVSESTVPIIPAASSTSAHTDASGSLPIQ